MNTVEPTTSQSLGRDLLFAARYYLGGRRGLLLLGAIAAVAGVASSWSWLVAAGIAPLLLSVAPCVAMCALGLCMHRATGNSCAAQKGAPDSDRLPASGPPAEVSSTGGRSTIDQGPLA